MSDERDSRIEAKLDKVVEHIGSIDSTLAAQAVSLADHIRRTEILEKQIEPVKTAMGIGKILIFVATVGAGIEGFILLIQWLNK